MLKGLDSLLPHGILVCALLAGWLHCSCLAQEPTPLTAEPVTSPSSLPPLESIAEFFGIPKTSRFYQSFNDETQKKVQHAVREGMKRRKDAEQGNAPANSSQADGVYEEWSKAEEAPMTREIDEKDVGPAPMELPVIKHYRSTHGIPLPKAEEIPDLFNLSREEIETGVKEAFRQALPELARLYTAQPLPLCEESKTEKGVVLKGPEGRKTRKTAPADKSASLKFDVVYLLPEQMPLNSEMTLGAKTTVRPYRAGSKDKASLLAQLSQIPCLPYRVRVTEKARYVHYGLDALKNYDKNPDGKGILLESMKRWEADLNKGEYNVE